MKGSVAQKKNTIKRRQNQPPTARAQNVSRSAKRRANRRTRDFELGIGGVDIPGLGRVGNIKMKAGRNDTVGVAPRSMHVQTVMPRITSRLGGRYGMTDVLVGTEFLASVNSADGGNITGDILETILINPTTFENTRLIQFSRLYQRYRFRKMNFVYEPIANATVSGQLIGFGDYDVDNIIVGNDPSNVSFAAAHVGNVNTQVWEPCRFPFGVLDDFTTLFTSTNGGQEDRLIYQGVYYLLAASDLPSLTALGNIYIEYEIELNIPILESTMAAPSAFFGASLALGSESGGWSQWLGSDPLTGMSLPAGMTLPNNTVMVNADYNTTNGFVVQGLPPGKYWLFVGAAGAYFNSSGGAGYIHVDCSVFLEPGHVAVPLTSFPGADHLIMVDSNNTTQAGFKVGAYAQIDLTDLTPVTGEVVISIDANVDAISLGGILGNYITLISQGELTPSSMVTRQKAGLIKSMSKAKHPVRKSGVEGSQVRYPGPPSSLRTGMVLQETLSRQSIGVKSPSTTVESPDNPIRPRLLG